MKIKINPKPIVMAELNISEFRKEFNKTFSLKKTIISKLKINSFNEELVTDENKAKEFVYIGTDWGNILMLFEAGIPENIKFNVYACGIKDFHTYRPFKKDTETNTIETKDEVVDIKEIIVTNSFNTKLDKHLEYTLAQHLIDYINYNWTTVIAMRDSSESHNV